MRSSEWLNAEACDLCGRSVDKRETKRCTNCDRIVCRNCYEKTEQGILCQACDSENMFKEGTLYEGP